MVLSPLYACVVSLFLTICNKFYEVHLDNFYMSAKCSHLSHTHRNCVKLQEVYRTGVWVIPKEVLQNELHDNKTVGRIHLVGVSNLFYTTYLSSQNHFISLNFIYL